MRTHPNRLCVQPCNAYKCVRENNAANIGPRGFFYFISFFFFVFIKYSFSPHCRNSVCTRARTQIVLRKHTRTHSLHSPRSNPLYRVAACINAGALIWGHRTRLHCFKYTHLYAYPTYTDPFVHNPARTVLLRRPNNTVISPKHL